MKLRWGIGLGLLVLAGCDASVCTNRNSSGACDFSGFEEFDAAPFLDATTPASDAAVRQADGAVVVPGTDAGMDATVLADAGPVVPASLTVEQFCEARFATAVAWRNVFSSACCANNADRDLGATILGANFGYTQDAAPGMDTVDLCASGLKALPPANLTYVATAANACAAKLSAQFGAGPASSCPAGGIDAQMLEATVGHQALPPVQIPECRAALVGNLALNATCTNPLECKAPYRCVDLGGNKSCHDALTASSACKSSSECADGLLCVTSAGSTTGKVCRPISQPLDVTVPCTSSTECAVGTLCSDAQKCATPVAQLICK